MCEAMPAFFTFLLFLSYTSLTVGQSETKLERQKRLPEDDFLLPRDSADCPRKGKVYAPLCRSKFNAAPLGGCWCQCGSLTEEKTFYEPRNSCVKVSVARQDAGCDLLFTDETEAGVLTFFPQEDFPQKAINLPVNTVCSLYYRDKLYAQYLGCDGAWNEVPSQSVTDSLEVTHGWTTGRLQIRSKARATIFSNNTGRIFRLAVQCRHQQSNAPINSSCVMFKVEGTVICPYPQQTPSRPSAPLPTPTLEINTTTEKTNTEKPTEKPTTGPPSEITSKPSQNPNVLGDTGTQKLNKRNTFIIAGSVAGGILLIALILLILWRCNNPRAENPHRRLDGSISRPISQMGRNSIPVYNDAPYLTPMGTYAMRSNGMDSPSYRKGSDGIILGPDIKRGSLYSDYSPNSAPPRYPPEKRSSRDGHVNPGLSLREDIVTMSPLYEGQVVEHNDLEAMNRSEFGVHPEQIVLEDRKKLDEFKDTYDCPEEILNSKPMSSTPLPVYYVVDDPYPDSTLNTFSNGGIVRGRTDGHVYDEPEVDLSRSRPYVVMDNSNGVAYTHDEPPRDEMMSMRRQSSPDQGISVRPNNQRYHSEADYDDGHIMVI